MRIRNGLIVVWCSIILIGCGGGGETAPATDRTFAGLTMTIPEGFEEVPTQLVENRQITNQVLYAGKQLIDDPEQTYAINLVVTTSMISTGLNHDQFAQVNNDKMDQYMVGYTRESYEQASFECQDQEIPGVLTTFLLDDGYYQPARTYLFHHYQFVYDEQGYIVSLAGLPDQSRALGRLSRNVRRSLGCVSTNTSA